MPAATIAGAQTAPANAGGTQASQMPSGQQNQAAAVVPFVRASQEHAEGTFLDATKQQSTANQGLGPAEVAAYGFLRHLVVKVETTIAIVGTAMTVAEDAPFSAIANLALVEPNGDIIVQFASGYSLYLANKYGGYKFANDMRAKPSFVNTLSATGGTLAFILRVPVELNNRDGLGSLPNQSAAAAFKLLVDLAASSALFSAGTPSTQGTFRVRAWLEAWDQPAASSEVGQNQQEPPAVNTTQFLTETTYAINSGNFKFRLTRVGNYIRNLIFVFRAATRALGESNWPDPLTWFIDSRPQELIEIGTLRDRIHDRYGYGGTGLAGAAIANEAANGRDAGVFVLDFCHEFDGQAGHENRDLWLETEGGTKLEIQGTFGAAGTMTVLTNDVSVAGAVFL